MQAIKCPACNKFTSGNRLDCLACGSSLVPQSALPIQKIKSQQDSSAALSCPKCQSTSLSGNKKGFGLGKAVAGGLLIGGIGLLSGFFGSRKIEITCMQCGHTWDAGHR